MKRVRGFGKNYFTLAAIQAYSSEVTREAEAAIAAALCRFGRFAPKKEDEDSPPDETEGLCHAPLPERHEKPCHCNRYFRRLAWLLLHLSERFKRPPCRCRYTKTGLAPPLSLPI